jgi:dihydrofolate reductase
MGKIIISQFVTLDGVMEDPGGSEGTPYGGWAFKFNRGPEGDKFKMEEVAAAEVLLLGRKTYEGFAAAWPGRSGDGFAEKMNGMPKYVVSRTLQRADWNNSTIIGDDAAKEIAGIKQRVTGDILINGSIQLVQALMKDGLVDEYRLMVYPVVLGAGKRLFETGSEPASLQLVSAQPMGEVLTLIYRPKQD